jgi:hypothetical protein
MKPNTPSLLLYFAICIFVVLFKLLEYDAAVLYAKSIVIPLVFIYYLITNEYKISIMKVTIFLFCFIGDIFNLLNFDVSPLVALCSFLLVYVLLLKLSYDDFRRLKFNKSDVLSIFFLVLFIAILSTSILGLKFEKMKIDLSLYVMYGITLSVLTFFCSVNYIKKQNYAFLNSLIMCLCFMISDIFYLINTFYFSLYALSFIHIFVQVFSYFFMVSYFIENDKYLLKAK